MPKSPPRPFPSLSRPLLPEAETTRTELTFYDQNLHVRYVRGREEYLYSGPEATQHLQRCLQDQVQELPDLRSGLWKPRGVFLPHDTETRLLDTFLNSDFTPLRGNGHKGGVVLTISPPVDSTEMSSVTLYTRKGSAGYLTTTPEQDILPLLALCWKALN